MLQPIEPRIVTPVAWMEAPEFLTPEEASRLTGHSIAIIGWLIDDDAVELVEGGNGFFIENQSLFEFQERLALVQHWDD